MIRSANIILFLILALPPISWIAPASAGETLQAIKARGQLRCGVSIDKPGFAARSSTGRWEGLEIDFCRAVAAAVLGNPEKVEFVPLKASERFPALKARRIDLLARQTTWTLTREALLGLQFPGVFFYDGQSFMVPKDSKIKTIADLDGATVCVERGTREELRLVNEFRKRGLSIKPLIVDSPNEAAEALFSGRCQAYTSIVSQLAAMRLRAPGGPETFTIFPEQISKDPLGPVVLRGDDDWVTLVRWVLFSLLLAEESGITRDSVETVVQQQQNNPEWQFVTGSDPLFAKALGVQGDWAVRAIKAVGNYGEIFERNVGGSSPLKLERGLNRLGKDGGLMCAPPIN